MDVKQITKKILWLGMEDYSGLWEILWELNTLYPEISETKKYELAQNTVQALIDKGYLNLYRCEEPYDKLSKVSSNEAYSLIDDFESWKEPKPNSISLRIGTTQKGEDAYKSFP